MGLPIAGHAPTARPHGAVTKATRTKATVMKDTVMKVDHLTKVVVVKVVVAKVVVAKVVEAKATCSVESTDWNAKSPSCVGC